MIEFNGITELSFGLTVKNIRKTVLPPIENRFVRKVASDGSFDFGSFFGNRVIEITFQDKTSITRKELYENMVLIAQWLYPPDKETKKLEILDDCCSCGENDLFYMAKVDGQTNLEEILEYGFFTAIFVAPDPFKFADDVLEAIANGGATTMINNLGTAPSRALILVTFTANASLFAIEQIDTGEQIVIVDSFVNTDSLVIDTFNETVTLNGSNELANLDLSSRFFSIPSGMSTYVLDAGDTTTTLMLVTPLFY